jgi:hypothetical protein
MKTTKNENQDQCSAQLLPATLSNNKCIINYFPAEKQVRGSDLTDLHNEPRFFTRSKRGLDAAWKVLCVSFDEQMTMYFAAQVLSSCGVKVHSYCAVD